MKSILMTARVIPVTMGRASIRSMAMSVPVNPATLVGNLYVGYDIVTLFFGLELGCYMADNLAQTFLLSSLYKN